MTLTTAEDVDSFFKIVDVIENILKERSKSTNKFSDEKFHKYQQRFAEFKKKNKDDVNFLNAIKNIKNDYLNSYKILIDPIIRISEDVIKEFNIKFDKEDSEAVKNSLNLLLLKEQGNNSNEGNSDKNNNEENNKKIEKNNNTEKAKEEEEEEEKKKKKRKKVMTPTN